MTDQVKKQSSLSRNKSLVWRIVNADEELKNYQPFTKRYQADRVGPFLERFHTVFVKPNSSYGGDDVIKVTKREQTYQTLHNGQLHSFGTVEELTTLLDSIVGKRHFVIQQGVSLAKWKGSAVDMRTIAIEKDGVWKTTAMCAKVAKKGMAVTNVKAGGRVETVEAYLRGIGLDQEQQKRVIQEMKSLSERIGHLLAARYKHRVFGLDIGLDSSGKIWLIEVNTLPGLKILRQIDRNMHKRTMRRLGHPWKY